MTQDSAASSAPTAAGQPATVGEALRALRNARGWTLEEVSSRIKFSPRQIAALEEERWQALPTGVSLRGMIRNYARLLGADGEAIAASIEAAAPSAAPARPSVRGLHGGHAVAGMPVEDERPSSASWGWLLAILLVVAAAVAYAFWQGWLPREWLSFQWISHLVSR